MKVDQLQLIESLNDKENGVIKTLFEVIVKVIGGNAAAYNGTSLKKALLHTHMHRKDDSRIGVQTIKHM